MPRKSEQPDREVRVIVDTSFTYRLDASRNRTLPSGWRGRVPGDIAGEIEAAGAGRVLGDPDEIDKPAAKKARARKPSGKRAASTSDKTVTQPNEDGTQSGTSSTADTPGTEAPGAADSTQDTGGDETGEGEAENGGSSPKAGSDGAGSTDAEPKAKPPAGEPIPDA